MTIDIRGMRCFAAVATAGSISRAAINLHIAQPALSVQIKSLEEELGARLFERTSRGVSLTAAGERFLVHCNDILRRIDVAYDDLREAVNEPSGRVAVGLPQSMARLLTLPLTKEILRRWPKIAFQMIELSSGYIPEYLANRHIDIGLSFGTIEDAGLRFTHLLDEELVLVTSTSQLTAILGARAVHKKEVEFARLAEFGMILPTEAHSLRSRINEFLGDGKMKLKVIAEVNTIPQLLELAAEGVASSILSYASVYEDHLAGKVAMRRIVKPRMFRPVYLCRSNTAPLTIATALVSDLLIDMAGQMTTSGEWPTQ